MDRRLAKTLVLAMAAHASMVVFTRTGNRPPVAIEEPPSIVEVVEEPEPQGSTPTASPEAPKAEVQKSLGIVASNSKPLPARTHEVVTALSGTTSIESTASSLPPTSPGAPSDDGSKVASSGTGAKKSFPGLIDLGSPGKHTFILPTKSDAPTKEEAVAANLDKTVKAALDAHDHEVGSGSGGPVASAAHSAALGPKAPETGRATYEVQTDGGGAIVAVRLVDSNGDQPGWESVGSALRAALGGQKLKVPSGAKGVLVKVLVEAAMKLPSGATQLITVAPQGIGVGGKFDLSDIGAKRSRVVAVRIVEERRL